MAPPLNTIDTIAETLCWSWDLYNPINKTGRLEQRVNALVEELGQVNLDSPDIENEHAVIKACYYQRRIGSAVSTAALSDKLLAVRLRIGDPVHFSEENNPGFKLFAEKFKIYHALNAQGRYSGLPHRITLINNKVQFKNSSWETFYNALTDEEKRLLRWHEQTGEWKSEHAKAKALFDKLWVYGPDGIQKESSIRKAGTPLSHYKIEPEPYQNSPYLLIFCSCTKSSLRMKGGDHAWVELKAPDGRCYSIGPYREDKPHGCKGGWRTSMRTQIGHFRSPDPTVNWPLENKAAHHRSRGEKIQEIKAEIDEKTFNEIKAYLEELDIFAFNNQIKNCTRFDQEIARMAGIELDLERDLWELVFPQPLVQLLKVIGAAAPPLAHIASCFAAVVSNLIIAYVFGATQVSPETRALLEERGLDATPHISSFEDLFDPQKAKMTHPFTLGNTLRREVDEWRSEERRKLGAAPSEEELMKIDYSLPPHFYILTREPPPYN